MEVILMDDVEALGHEGDVVRVADGYGRNYLIPRELAVPATRGAKRQLELRRGSIAKREVGKADKAGELAEQLRAEPLQILAKGGTQGRLHGSVTTQQIADALAEQKDFEIDRRRITLAQSIREVGDYLITAQLYKGVDVQLAVTVTADVDPDDIAREEAEALAEAEATAHTKPGDLGTADDDVEDAEAADDADAAEGDESEGDEPVAEEAVEEAADEDEKPEG